MKQYRYALDQTFTKNETYRFLEQKAIEHECTVYGYYKGNGKQTTDKLIVYGKILSEKIQLANKIKDTMEKNK